MAGTQNQAQALSDNVVPFRRLKSRVEPNNGCIYQQELFDLAFDKDERHKLREMKRREHGLQR